MTQKNFPRNRENPGRSLRSLRIREVVQVMVKVKALAHVPHVAYKYDGKPKRKATSGPNTRSKKQATNWRMGAIDDSSRVNMQPAGAMAMQWEPSV
mgnify:CR=1 FL=1